MIKKLLFSLLFMVFVTNTNAQSIGIIGDFSSWSSDIVMNTSDNVNYTLTHTFLITGGVKFRQDAAWTNNWGSTAFPSGVGTPGGSNIPVPAGTYDIAFNITTGAYSFTVVSTNYDSIGVYGGFNSWATPSEPLVTADGVLYSKIDYHFTADGVKFIKDNNTATTWGGTAFPSGTATAGGATIPLTAGFYNVDFNKNTLLYNFVQVPVSMIGDAVSDWSTDVDMISTDGGVTFTLSNVTLVSGALKFRANYSWANNWGNPAFPSGTGDLNGNNANIPVNVAGTYNVTFNRITGAYNFTLLSSAYNTTNFNGSPMTTTDGVNYIVTDVYLASASTYQFTDPNNGSVWGASAYPAGTATVGSSSMIPVPAGYFNISFNRSTGNYSFTVSSLSIIGSATTAGWSNDAADLTSTDNGLTFSLSSIALTAGDVKFRVNHSWTTSYGAGTGFPSGTSSTSGSGNIAIPTASTYNVTFDRTTGAYTFTDVLSTNQFGVAKFALYPNPTTGSFAINGDFTKAQVYTLTGQLVKTFSFGANEYSIADLNSGVYLVKVSDSENNSKTMKLIKK